MTSFTIFLFFVIFLASSVLFVYLANSKSAKKIQVNIGKISFQLNGHLVIGLAIPTLLIGLRPAYIGVDTDDYIREFEWIASGSGWSSGTLEASFNILSYLSNTLTGGHYLLFCIYSAITITFFYLAIKRWVPTGDIWRVYALMLFMLLPFSFNIMRHMAAVAVVFYSLRYAFDRDLIKWIIGIACASILHISAVAILPLYLLTSRKFSGNALRRSVLYFKPFIIYLAFIVVFAAMIPLLASTGIMPDRYLPYINVDNQSDKMLLASIAWVVIVSIFLYKNKLKDDLTYLLSLSLLALPLSALNLVMYAGGRLAYYIIPVIMLTVYAIVIKPTRNKVILNLTIILSCITFFTAVYYIAGYSGIISDPAPIERVR